MSIMGRVTKGACGDKGEGEVVTYKSEGVIRGRILKLHED